MLRVCVTLALSSAAVAAPLNPGHGTALHPSASSHDARADMAKYHLSGKQAEALQQLKEMDSRKQAAPGKPAKRGARLIVGGQRNKGLASQIVHEASVDEEKPDSQPSVTEAAVATPAEKPAAAEKAAHKPEHAKRHPHASSERELQDLRMKMRLSDDKVEEIRHNLNIRKNEKGHEKREERFAKAEQKFKQTREKDEKELTELEQKMHLPAYKIEQMRQQMVSHSRATELSHANPCPVNAQRAMG